MRGSMLGAALVVLAVMSTTSARSVAEEPVDTTTLRKVYITNYNEAETHVTMAGTMALLNISLGQIFHFRAPTPVLNNGAPQVVRMNRDTLYSNVVFDLKYSAATVELGATGGHYHSLYCIDESQYSIIVHYADDNKPSKVTFSYKPPRGGSHSKESDERKPNKNKLDVKVKSKTRYINCIFRTLTNPKNTTDLNRAWALQNAVKIVQSNTGKFEVPNWDKPSLIQVRSALAPLSRLLPRATGLNGFEGKIDPTIHLIGTAALFLGLPKEAAAYDIVYPTVGYTGVYKIVVPANSVPIGKNGFWSVSVYDANGFLPYNTFGSYSINSITALPETDGSVVIYFSAAKQENMKNWIYIYNGWNYMSRQYVPLDAILNDEYHFPELTVVS